jgi:hypothetical protein
MTMAELSFRHARGLPSVGSDGVARYGQRRESQADAEDSNCLS